MEDPDLLKFGAIPLLCLVLYALVDKVISPLLIQTWKNGTATGHPKERGERNGYDTDVSPTRFRLERLEQDLHDLSASFAESRNSTHETISEIKVSARVSQAILKRLERQLNDL